MNFTETSQLLQKELMNDYSYRVPSAEKRGRPAGLATGLGFGWFWGCGLVGSKWKKVKHQVICEAIADT